MKWSFKIEKKVLKTLLELAADYDEANKIMEKYTDAPAIKDKLQLLEELYGDQIQILDDHKHDGSNPRTDYEVMIATIINKKWW